MLVAAALELLEQDVGDTVDDVPRRAVERLVIEVEEGAALGAEAAAEGDAEWIGDGGGVERPRRGACQLTTIGVCSSCTQRRPT